MKEENIRIDYETIGVIEQRNLFEITHTIARAMTKEDYRKVILVYNSVIDRLEHEAKKQGIDI